MSEFQRICGADQVEEGGTRTGFYGVKRVVLTRVDGTVRAFVNACPHAGAPLSGGSMRGPNIICQRHGWAFDTTTGQCADHPMYELRLYLVEERDGGVWIKPAVEEIW